MQIPRSAAAAVAAGRFAAGHLAAAAGHFAEAQRVGAGLRGPSQGQTSNADLMQHLWQMSQQHLVSVRLSLGRASLRLVRPSRVPAKVELDELNLAWHAGMADGG